MQRIELLRKQVTAGNRVCLLLSGGTTIEGQVLEVGTDYVLLDTARGSSTVFGELLSGWQLVEHTDDSSAHAEQTPAVSATKVESVSPHRAQSTVEQRIIEIEVQFKEREANATLQLLPPNFTFPEFQLTSSEEKFIRKEWARLHDQYQYANKIKELSRLNQQIPAWKSLIESFPFISAFHFNCGCLHAALGKEREALLAFQTGSILAESPELWFNLACIALRLEKREIVCYALEKYFQQIPPTNALPAWYIFVGHLIDFRNYRALSGIFENSLQKHASPEEVRLALETSVYLLKINDQYGKSLETLSEMTETLPEPNKALPLLSSILLDFPQVPTAEYQGVVQELGKLKDKADKTSLAADGDPPGHISNFGGGKGFGFIESRAGETLFFHVKNVEDDSLKAELQQNWNGKKIPVWFIVQQSPGHKYAQATSIIRFEDPQAALARAIALADAGNLRQALSEIAKVVKLDPLNLKALKLEEQWRAEMRASTARQSARSKSQTPYAQAKQSDSIEKDYKRAEELYLRAIAEGDNRESAIKDLACLLQKQKRDEEAISLLQQHRPQMQDKRAVDNILSTFYQHMGRHDEAIPILQRINESTPEQGKSVILKRMALSYFKLQNYAAAEETLNAVLSYTPTDSIAQRWLAALRLATASGEYEDANQVIKGPEALAEYASELSSFALFHLDRCEFQGVEPDKIANEDFNESDVEKLENLAKTLGTRRPRERAAYYLSAAKILSLIQTEDNFSRIYSYLRRYFTSMGNAALADKKHLDVVRSFYCESFAVSLGPRIWELEEPNLVLARYLYSVIEQPENLSDFRFLSITETVNHLQNHSSEEGLFDAILYASIFSRGAADKLLNAIFEIREFRENALRFLEKRGVTGASRLKSDRNVREFVLLWQQLRQDMADRQARRYAEFMVLRQFRLSVDSVEDFIQQIDRLMQEPVFDLDRQRLLSLRQIALTIYDFCRQSEFEEQERLSSLAIAQTTALRSEIIQSPTKLSLESVLPVVEHLRSVTEERLGEVIRTARPEVSIFMPVESYTPNSNWEILLQLSIRNSQGSSPVVSPTLMFQSDPMYYQMSPLNWPLEESLRGGGTRTVQIPMRVTEEAVKSRAFPLRVAVGYRNRGGELFETKPDVLTVRLYPASEFAEIKNPYAAYVMGGPVVEKEMFYGRDELVSNLTHAILSSQSRNKSVVIYGQKRAGKSSVLQHLKGQLHFPVLGVDFSVQDFEVELSYPAFLYRILQRLSEVVEEESYQRKSDMKLVVPAVADFMNHPTAIFHQVMGDFQRECRRNDDWKAVRVVLLIDEFTDIYKAILRGLIPDTFMKTWKALIEKQYFGVVLVGQDVMPQFKERFPNEFGVLQEERVSYLSDIFARKLVEDPIRIRDADGGSETRYRAQAVEKVLDLTAGSPFYIQIVCNRLVDYMNQHKAKFITDADVERVKNELLSGVNSLQPDKFDNLYTAGDASLDRIPPDETLSVCKAIAQGSRIGWCSRAAIECNTSTSVDEILKDLVARDVVERKGAEDYRIRVGLFREWLIASN